MPEFSDIRSNSTIAAGEPGSERDRQELGIRFTSIRADILETLRRHGHIMDAFELAEHYRDFRMLVALCHTGVVYPPEDNPHAERIASYVDGFGDAFTMELHQWYIEHGRVFFSPLKRKNLNCEMLSR
jgi:nuclear pore complex protein Nup133